MFRGLLVLSVMADFFSHECDAHKYYSWQRWPSKKTPTKPKGPPKNPISLKPLELLRAQQTRRQPIPLDSITRYRELQRRLKGAQNPKAVPQSAQRPFRDRFKMMPGQFPTCVGKKSTTRFTRSHKHWRKKPLATE